VTHISDTLRFLVEMWSLSLLVVLNV